MAPRPGGFFAAVDAAPDADVFFVAHTGLDRIRTVSDVWRELPTDKTIVMRFWNVPRGEIPIGPRRTDRLAHGRVGGDRRVGRAEPPATGFGHTAGPAPAGSCRPPMNGVAQVVVAASARNASSASSTVG